ncbi:MFS transporter [Planotetraspora phitsanulokensis]|uniref:MFS transporter n=1 Tax=Planotetraspora phitsanulokensis TaxID=575192 RepID=A0A8J3UMA8_9ACTN|nr:MFS transporter [Planotetraspora phitsanulokensis]
MLSLALGAAIIVTTEFTPVGFLPNVSRDLDVSLGTAGLMVLVPGLSAAVAAPLVVVGSGRLDRRLLIVVLSVLVLLSNGVAAVAPNFGVVVVARVFLGVAIGGFWAVVPSLGFRLAGPRAGTRATSIILAGLSVGTVVGLPAGQFFGNLIGWRLTFAASAALAALIGIGQLTVLPKIPATGRMTFAHLGEVFRVPIARTILIAGGVATTGQFAASTFVTPFLLRNAEMSSGFATVLFIAYGLAGILGTLAGPALVERDRMLTFAGAAAVFGVVLASLPALAGAPVLVSVLIGAWGVLWGLVPLALQTHMLTATPHAPEAASSIFITVMQLAIAIGSGVGGVLVDSAGLSTVFVASGITAIASAFFALLTRHGL